MPTASPSRLALCVHFMATPWSSGPTPIGLKASWAASQPGGPCLDSIQEPPGDSPAAMVDWRLAVCVHGDQLHRPPDAQRAGAIPEVRISLDELGFCAVDHFVPRRLRSDADGGGAPARQAGHPEGPADFGHLVFDCGHDDRNRI